MPEKCNWHTKEEKSWNDYQDDDEIIDIDESEQEMASQAKKNTISLPVFALITKMTSLIPT